MKNICNTSTDRQTDCLIIYENQKQQNFYKEKVEIIGKGTIFLISHTLTFVHNYLEHSAYH